MNAISRVAFFAAGLLVGWATTLYRLHPPQTSGDCASWVQAIGAICAIGVAIYVPYQQRREEMRQSGLRYWSARVDVEQRMLLVAGEVWERVQKLIEDSKPSTGATRLVSFGPDVQIALREKISAIENRDIGDSGHARIATMRAVVDRLSVLVPAYTGAAIKPGSSFSQKLAEGPIAQDAQACYDETTNLLEEARASIERLAVGP